MYAEGLQRRFSRDPTSAWLLLKGIWTNNPASIEVSRLKLISLLNRLTP